MAGGGAGEPGGSHGWKAHLVRSGYRPATINSMLAALNAFPRFIGLEDCRVRALRVQRRLFQSEERELSRQEYQRLLDTARTLGRDRLALVMETICAAGIRVSEVQLYHCGGRPFRSGGYRPQGQGPHHPPPRQAVPQAAQVRQTAKNRFRRDLPHQKRQASVQAADLGGDEAPVPPGRGGPHQGLPSQPAPSLCAHLLSGHPDVAKLADVLGHSSIETTRIYLISTGAQHRRDLDRLRLVC